MADADWLAQARTPAAGRTGQRNHRRSSVIFGAASDVTKARLN